MASGATLATLFSACGGSPTSPSRTASMLGVVSGRFAGSGVQVTVAGSPLDNVGGAALVESTAGVFLVSRTSATAFMAVDAICSHESCTVTGADGNVYVCPVTDRGTAEPDRCSKVQPKRHCVSSPPRSRTES